MASGRVGDAVVGVLQAASVRTVFGIPGIHTLGLYDALAGTPSIRHILTRHEQGAAFAADGYARVLGVPGVCSTTTGPGTFNTLAGVAEAWSDSSPVVILAGQIDAALDGSGRGVLHETPDQGRSFEALTAFTGRPRTTAAIPAAVGEALRCSMTGRHRPAYVELPTDLLLEPYDGDIPTVDFPDRSCRTRRLSSMQRGCCRGLAGRDHARVPASIARGPRPSCAALRSGSTRRS